MSAPGIARARIVVLMVVGMIIGAAGGGIFDIFQWPLIVAPIVPAAAMIALLERGPAVRGVAAALAVGVAVAVAVLGTSGSFGDFVDAFTAGPQRLLSTEWPSPVRADLVGTIAALLATATALSSELARRKRWHLAPLLPSLAVAVVVVGLSAPLGVRWGLLVAMCASATVFASLRDDQGFRHRVRFLRGERRLVPLLFVATFTTAIVSVPIGMQVRADPRRAEPAEQTAPLLDPIEATNALRALDPPIVLHQIDMSSSGAAPTVWRTAALENYDGVRWTPDLTLRPIGRTLGPREEPVIEYDVSFLDDDTSLVPFPGTPVSVAAAVETDPERTVVRLIERPTVGDIVAASATGIPTADDALIAGLGVRAIDDSVSGLTELAEELGGEGTVFEQLRQMETTMRGDWDLDSEVPGGGLQQALIERFLRDTKRGNTEQFASGFALLARSLGVDARVATGFRVAPSTATTIGLESAAATVWPEVRLDDGRWLPFEPVPSEEVVGGEPPPPEPQVQTPAAPQPPIPPPPEPASDTDPADTTDQETTTGALSAALTWVLRGIAVIGVAALPLLIAMGAILGLKYRRRRRRLHAPDPAARIKGAWATATDALVDAGLPIAASSTDAEIAGAGETVAAGARRSLRRLALLSTSATFGGPPHPELLANDAATCLANIETTMADDRTWWQRMRWRLSLRSLRRSTRSPVSS